MVAQEDPDSAAGHAPGFAHRYGRQDVVVRALELLDRFGLPDLTMRRLGAELGVRPSALYHHIRDKQSLLAAVADELLTRVKPPMAAGWEEAVVEVCARLRETLLSCRDGAELVTTAWSFGLGATAPYELLLAALGRGGGVGDLAPVAARTLLHFVYGHAVDEQTGLQAAEVGVIDAAGRESCDAADFAVGLSILVAGIGLARAVRTAS